MSELSMANTMEDKFDTKKAFWEKNLPYHPFERQFLIGRRNNQFHPIDFQWQPFQHVWNYCPPENIKILI